MISFFVFLCKFYSRTFIPEYVFTFISEKLLIIIFSLTANTKVTDQCHARYYCPAHSEVPKQVTCPEGKHCPLQSAEPQDCPAGTYVDYEGASECTDCPEGKWVQIL